MDEKKWMANHPYFNWKCPTCHKHFPQGTQHYCPGPDANTILADHPIYQKIRKQIDKGIRKYDTPVNHTHYSVTGWLTHWQEETIDSLTYQHTLEERLKQAKETLDILRSYSHSIEEDDLLEQLNHILFD